MSSATINQSKPPAALVDKDLSRQVNSRVCETIVLYRVVTAFIIASLLWKAGFYVFALSVYSTYSLDDSFFPSFFSSSLALGFMLVVPVVIGMASLVVHEKSFLIFQSAITLLCMFGLCIHQGSYNDVTFLTCFWVSLWCLWYAIKLGAPPRELIATSRKFAVLIISLIFLGGAVGKWTPGYWSGQVFYEIYFVDRDFWFFNLLRWNLQPDALREFATCYSRMVVLAESGCALLWLLPVKLAGGIALTMLVVIALFSNVYLFSVVACLCGLAVVCLHEPKGSAFGA